MQLLIHRATSRLYNLSGLVGSILVFRWTLLCPAPTVSDSGLIDSPMVDLT
jgi:hypothetical protein